MTSPTKGILAIILAGIIWGFSPIYYKLLVAVPPFELLSHRTLWSFIFFFLILVLKGQVREFKSAIFRSKNQLIIIIFSSLLIAINWFFFIAAIQSNKATEVSLGYFIMPLVTVIWGLIFFKEKLSALQWFSVVLAAFAVFILTIELGVPPWIALILSFSFSIYAVLKKKLEISPIVSVTGEVFILIPIGLSLLFFFHLEGNGSFGENIEITVLLILSGPITAAPLILFSYGAHRVSLSTVGILQYLNPSLQFFCAAFIFLEPLTSWHMLSFSLIWIALIVYSWVGVKSNSKQHYSVT